MGRQEKRFTKACYSLILGYPRQNMPLMLLLRTRCFGIALLMVYMYFEEFDKYMFLFVWCKVNRGVVRSGAQRRQELEGGELDCVSPIFCQW